MNKFITFTLAAIFIANTYVVSAWSEPCIEESSSDLPVMHTMHSIHSVDNVMEIPCHEEGEAVQTKYCEGVCLCDHVAMQQSLDLFEANSAISLFTLQKSGFISDSQLISIVTTPARRPPKINS